MEKKYTYEHPHPAVTTDCVVFGFDGQELNVLLVERGVEPYKGMWAFPGGFLRMDETAEECAYRELREETGLELRSIRQLGAFSGVNRDPRERVVTIAFYAMAQCHEVRGGDDALKARWWNVREVPPLAFDHDFIFRQAMERIRHDIHFEPIGFDLLGEQFTIAELQRLYESILGKSFDRRNFYKKMMQSGIVDEVEETKETAPVFYGSGKELKRMSIGALFGESIIAKASEEYSPFSEDTGAESAVERHQGRRGKLFIFNKENYDRMKEDGRFKLEF